MSIKRNVLVLSIAIAFGLAINTTTYGQEKKAGSIGGPEHEAHIYGVRIGMDIPTALEAVFVNANRKPGQEKPDGQRREGKGKKDVRVVYKDLPKGELQIVFADARYVSEVSIIYREPPLLDDLRLPFTSTIGSTSDTANETSATGPGVRSPAVLDGDTSIEEFGTRATVGNEKLSASRVGNIGRGRSDLLDGTRYDDRYSIGYTDNLKQQKLWWRDEDSGSGYKVRVAFIGKKNTEAGAKFVASVVQKTVTVKPGDKKKLAKSKRDN